MPQRTARKVKSLLSNSAYNASAEVEELNQEKDAELSPPGAAKIVSYYHPNLTLALMNDPEVVLPYTALAAPVAKRMCRLSNVTSNHQCPLLTSCQQTWRLHLANPSHTYRNAGTTILLCSLMISGC